LLNILLHILRKTNDVKSSESSKAPGSAKVPSLLSRSSSATEPSEYWAILILVFLRDQC
jgi:hypothetical protein